MKIIYSILFIFGLGCVSTQTIKQENSTKQHVLEELGITIDLPIEWVIERNFNSTKYDFTANSPLNENEEFNSIYFTYEDIPLDEFSSEYSRLITTIKEKHKMSIENEGDFKVGNYDCKRILAISSESTNLTYVIPQKESSKTYLIFASSTYQNGESQINSLDRILSSLKINTSQNISIGHELYLQNCGSCHGLSMKENLTGPALGGISNRRTLDWTMSFINNSQSMYENGDSLVVQIIDYYGGQQIRCGSGKPRSFNKAAIECIIDFIEHENSK